MFENISMLFQRMYFDLMCLGQILLKHLQHENMVFNVTGINKMIELLPKYT